MKRALAMLGLMLCSTGLLAQTPQGNDPFNRHLYPPDLVMSRQNELGLTDKQRDALRADVLTAQTAFTKTQWQLSDEGEKLTRLLATPTVDEAAVLAQVDRVLTIENELKKHQMRLMVRVKNILTAPQQAKLDAIRSGGVRPPDGE